MKISKLISFGILLVILYVLFNSFVIDLILRNFGRCAKSYIYTVTSPGRTAPDLKYRFYVGKKEYNGFIGKEYNLEVGDSVCIVYWGKMPNKNRPVNYFENDEMKCDCKE